MPTSLHIPFARLLLLLLFLGTLGCENTISPYSDRATYSVWGYLSLTRTQQFVRVKDLDQPLASDTSDLPELTVTLENLSSNNSTVLRDSVIFFEENNSTVATQNFWTERSIEPETKYRLTVEDETGTTVQATTTTPAPVTPTVAPDTGNCLSTFTVEFPGIEEKDRLTNVRLSFKVQGDDVRLSEENVGVIHLRSAASSSAHDNAFVTFEPESLLNLRFESVDEGRTLCTYESLCPLLATPDEEGPPPPGPIDTPDEEPTEYGKIAVSFVQIGPKWSGSLPEDTTASDPRETLAVGNGRGFFGSVHRSKIIAEVDTARNIPVDGPPFAPCNN